MKQCRTYNGLITSLKAGEPAVLKIVGKRYNADLGTYELKLPNGEIELVNMADGWGFIQKHLIMVEPNIESNKQAKAATSNPYKFKPLPIKDSDPLEYVLGAWEKNQKQLEYLDEKAKKDGSIIGRYINLPMGDGYAYYQVTSIKGNQARLDLITEIGDDWVFPMWGKGTVVSLQEVKNHISRRDALDKMLGRY